MDNRELLIAYFICGFLVQAGVFGCSGGEDPAGGDSRDTAQQDQLLPETLVRVSLSGAQPEEVAYLAFQEDHLLELQCPGPDTEVGSCSQGGAELTVAPPFTLTVKARGSRFQTLEVPESSGDMDLTVSLEPLDELKETEDYATGLEPGDPEEVLSRLAVSFDTELGPVQVVKFFIHSVSDNPVVYFQNTAAHPLHYRFASEVLGLDLDIYEFEKATYVGEARSNFAGSLLRYPQVSCSSEALGRQVDAPMVVTFFPSDNITPSQVALAHRLIEERLGPAARTGGADRLFYLPAGTYQEQGLTQVDLRSSGVPWLVRTELYRDLTTQILNPGLAYGTLRRMTPEDLENRVVSFRDILVLTRLPNSLPIVGGTITEELQTPLAHVNVAARTRGTPNLALLGAGTDPRIAALLDKLVRFEVKDGGFTLEPASEAEAQAYWASLHPEAITPPADVDRADLAGFEELGFEDSLYFGVKAANLAEMSNLIPDFAPRGFAVPFHYYQEFISTTPVSRELCEEARQDCVEEARDEAACERARDLCLEAGLPTDLEDYIAGMIHLPEVESDSVLRDAVLNGIRYFFNNSPISPDFAAALDARVAEVFGSSRIKLRSSTNAEDLESFSGAGLYTSVAAYATGDQQASKRIRKVWASTWSWSAFEERSFWNIDHLAVKMGICASPAFQDEAANGVLITRNIADPTTAGFYVNVQLGETPVTNPEGGAIPEIFSIIPLPGGGAQVARQRFSSLSPGVPIMTEGEINTLQRQAAKVQTHFASLYQQNPNLLALDLEFKLTSGDRGLVFKQVRPYSVSR